DMARVFKSDELPRLSRIGTLVHAIALQDVVANAGFAGADIHNVGIGLGNRDRADRGELFLVGHGNPIDAAVGRLPHPAADTAEVIGIRLANGSGDGQNASAAEWT